MTKTKLPLSEVNAADFYHAKTREFLRALQAHDTPAIYFLRQENESLRQLFNIVPPITFVPTDPTAERFKARYRDLNRAIFANDHLSAELCLNEYPLFLRTYNIGGESLQHIVCRAIYADQAMADIVSDRRDIFLDSFGNTPLNLATMLNRYDLVEFFSSFQNPNLRNSFGQNAFDFAFFNNNQEIINLLISQSFEPVLTEFQDYQQNLSNENPLTNNRVVVSELQVATDLDLEQVTKAEILLQDIDDKKEESLVVQSEVSLERNSATHEVINSEIPIATIEEKSQQLESFSKDNPETKKSWKQELRIRQREANLMLKEDKLSKAVEKDISNKAKQEILRQAQIEKSKLERLESLAQKEKEAMKLKEEEELLQSLVAENSQKSQKLAEIESQKILLFKKFLDEISPKFGFENPNLSMTSNIPEMLELSKKFLQNFFKITIFEKNTPLMEEILNHPIASEFLDLESKDQKEETPLILACRAGAFEIADLLIARGANVKATDENLQSALHYCAKHSGEDSFKTAKTIFEKSGNDVNFLKAHSNGMSVAMNCCRENGNHLIFKMVMDECSKSGQDYSREEKMFFMTAACEKENTKTAGVFLQMGLLSKEDIGQVLKEYKEKKANNFLQPTEAKTLKSQISKNPNQF